MAMSRGRSLSLLAATFLGTIDSNAMIPVIALYAASMGASPWLVGLVVAMYSIVHVPANIVFGRLVDKIGFRNPLVVGLAWDAVSVALYSLASDPFQLLLVRMSHGLGGGFVGPSSMGIASSLAPDDRKGRMMAKYGIAIALSVIAGFALGGVFIGKFGYTVFFYVVAGLLIIGMCSALMVREPEGMGRARTTLRQDFQGFISLLRRREVLSPYVSIFSLYFVVGAFTVLVPLYMEGLGMTVTDVVVAFTSFAVLSVLLHYPSGIVSDKVGPWAPATAGLVCVTIAMLVVPLCGSLQALLPVTALFGVGHGLVFPSTSTMVVKGTGNDVRGMASGVFYALLVAGVAVGAPVAGLVADASSFGLGLQSAAFVSFVGAVTMIWLTKRKV